MNGFSHSIDRSLDRFLDVAHRLQHLVQAVGIEQHHRLHQDDQVIGLGVPVSTVVKMPRTRSGIMVRIVVVAITKIDAKTAPAVPACWARCEVSMASQPALEE
jgi:hypothetical protein